jgi:exonuclease III
MFMPQQDKTDNMDSFYEELERVFDEFLKYNMKILLGDFNAKVGREDIFKPKIGTESLHEINNDNGVRVVHLATSKNLIGNSTTFAHRNIHKFTWTFPDGWVGGCETAFKCTYVRSFRGADCDTKS